jgi:hypothetical protein
MPADESRQSPQTAEESSTLRCGTFQVRDYYYVAVKSLTSCPSGSGGHRLLIVLLVSTLNNVPKATDEGNALF